MKITLKMILFSTIKKLINSIKIMSFRMFSAFLNINSHNYFLVKKILFSILQKPCLMNKYNFFNLIVFNRIKLIKFFYLLKILLLDSYTSYD